jgi:hypothetical protein
VDVDYLKVDIVDVRSSDPDKGGPLPYHPPTPDPSSFAHKINVAADGMIDTRYPEMNFNDWCAVEDGDKINLLTVSGTQFVIMRWDMSAFAGKKVSGGGLLELTTYSVQRRKAGIKDFGLLRVVEILGGDPAWDPGTVTHDSLSRGQPAELVFNTQMIIDVEANEVRDGRTLITISRPVLQRMIDGKTRGLAVQPLGAIISSFYGMEYRGGEFSARLYFDTE